MAIPAILSGIGKSLLGGGSKSTGAAKAGGSTVAQSMTGIMDNGGGESKSAGPSVSIIKRPSLNVDKYIDKEKVENVKVDVDDPKVDPLQQSLQGLTDIVNVMKSTSEDNVDVQKDEEKYNKKRRLGFSRMMRGIGGAVAGAVGFAKRMAKNIPFFDKLKNFFMNVLLGALATFLLSNVEKIVEVVESLIEKFKEFKKSFDEFMEMLNENLFKPIMSVAEAIVGPIANIVAKFMGVPDYEADENTISQNLLAIGKEIPIIGGVIGEIEKAFGDLMKSVEDKTGESYEYKPTGGGSSQYDTSSGGLLASGGAEQGSKAKEQVSSSGFGESEFTLYRDVVAQIESGGKYDIQGGSGNLYAGRYQMGAAARKDAARLLGEEYQGDSEAARKKFREDPQMQERYFAAYTRANHGYLMSGSPEYKGLSKEGKLQVLGYAHNAGWSRAAEWLKGGMSDSFKDGFGTRSDKYSTSIRSAQQQRKTGETVQPPSMRSGSPSGPVKAGNFFPKADIEIGEKAGFSESRGRVHAGRDIAAYSGTPLTVPSASVITDKGFDGGYGNYIVFKDSNGMEHLYGHLREQSQYSKGDNVNPGDTIGYVGSTGRSSGPHLHWEISPRMGEVGYGRENVIDPIEAGYDAQVPFTGGGSQPQVEQPPSKRDQKVSRSASYESSDHVAVVDIPTAAPSVSGGGGGTPTLASAGTGTDQLNRRQQHDYLQFLYKT